MEVPFLPMLVSKWIFGIGIIEYPLSKPQEIISYIYTIGFIVIYIYMNYNAYPTFLTFWLVKTRPLPEKTFYFSQIILTVSIIILGWFHTKGVHECFLNAATTENLMRKIGILNNNLTILKREFVRHVGFFSFIILMILLSVTMLPKSDTEELNIVELCIQIHPIIIVFLTDSAFINIVGYAHVKFLALNDVLRNLLTSTLEQPLHLKIAKQTLNEKIKQHVHTSEINCNDYTFLIKTARLAHLQLVKLCQKANSVFGLQILLSITITFITIIINIFNIYLLVYSDLSYDEIFGEIVKSTNMTLYFGIKSIINSWYCGSVCDISVASGDLICELYDEPLINEDTKQEIRYFNIQLIQSKLKFSAFGFVDIDPTLIQVMISTIGTFVVIMIQFQKVKFETSSE